jgi:hypothetical protein
MTCVCAVTDGSTVVMGGDSATSNDEGDRRLVSPKVFEQGGLLFGVSGELRVGQLVRHVYEVPAPREGQGPEEFVVRELCGGLRAFLREQADDLLPSQGDDEEVWQLLVGVQGRLFRICSHMTASETATGYDAIGSAAPQALGSLASTEGRPARERVEVALRAAERHHGAVASPFTVLSIALTRG